MSGRDQQHQVRLVVDNTQTAQLVASSQRRRRTPSRNEGCTDWSSVLLNEQEQHLIRLLRFTTYHGRNLVIQQAIAIRESHPWRDDRASFQTNIETSFPVEDQRFYSELKIERD
ncbi:hypothetical protein [Zoogloea sp. LCSB751]|uniref:hypothetical protein n=1 Tax=Zoogloea sp. LCSB751 TaxID=1965277 RepID=UPI0009A4B06E|nr:hypothetical protein [Zoogloea sp. LCSB751]